LLENNLPTSHMQMRDIRQAFAEHANRHLMRAGLDIRIDHRSHVDRGLLLEPTDHMGVHASQMQRRGLDVSRTRIEEQAAKRNADLIRKKPEEVLRLLTDEKSVFTRHDVARTLHRYITDNDSFQRAIAAVMASPQLVTLQHEQDGELARYSTRAMIDIEHAMAASALRMADRNSHAVSEIIVEHALDHQHAMLAGSGLSDEQRAAVRHITSAQQMSAVIGFAGAGKSTMLAAARDAWEAQGYHVHGAALAGKAAEGLTASSGIAARTLASWEYGWQNGKGELQRGDILVIDEAGMVGSRQLARFVKEVEARGAKLVLVGDHEQLQAIGAGSPFRAITERIGSVELTEIRRQKQDWQRDASIAFATHRTADGLRHYADRGSIQFADDRETACEQLVRDYLSDRRQNPDASRIALAHRRIDVRAINDGIRAALQADGLLAKSDRQAIKNGLGHDIGDGRRRGEQFSARTGAGRVDHADHDHENDREIDYQTVNGKRSFAAGDRIVLLENNRDLGVKNGMLGTVEAVEPNAIQIRLDGSSGTQNAGRHLTLTVRDYQAFDHGYATTIHKAQGATVDRSFVMASSTMDRHLTYVAMTRHREQTTLYAGRDDLKNMTGLVASLSRSGAKETTLDYTDAFAQRRGLAETPLHPQSEINLAATRKQAYQDTSRATPIAREEQDRPADGSAYEERAVHQAGPALKGETPRTIRAETGDRQNPAQQINPAAPLIPAITRYDRTVEEIAREKAQPHLERDLETLRSVGQNVYRDPFSVTATLKRLITDDGTDVQALVKTVKERPEQFGELRGKSGLLGDNKERSQARSLANGLSNHVGYAAQTWARRLEAERQSETWKREKCDVVEVPGLTPRSEAILKKLDGLANDEKTKFLQQMLDTPNGRQALAEANTIVKALHQRFGTADAHKIKDMDLRLGKDVVIQAEHIKQVARLAEKAQRDEMTRQHELKRTLKKGLGLGL
jgi:Ti-type conjugative transfer relaxase TraA